MWLKSIAPPVDVASSPASRATEATSTHRNPGRFEIPDKAPPESYFAALLFSSLAVINLGLQVTMTAFLVLKPAAQPREVLTNVGIFNLRPEHDLLIYLSGLLFTLFLVVAYVFLWNHWFRLGPMPTTKRSVTLSWVIYSLVGILAGSVYLWEFVKATQYVRRGLEVPASHYFYFAVTAAALIITSLSGLPRTFAAFPIAGLGRPASSFAKRPIRLLDVLFAVLIVLIVYIPSTSQLFEHIFQAERFFHWDFFAMSPALSFENGAALGTDSFSFYGLGWPVLFAAMSPLLKLSYGSMIQLSVIYGCLYFLGLYVLLRLLTNHPIWAAVGTFLALRLHLFSGLALTSPLWRFPSVTIMRRPLDVWFFVALLMYVRTRRPPWLIGAAGLTGAAFIFETDTGLYLGGALGLYWLAQLVMSRNLVRDGRLLAGSAAACASVVMLGLGIASRGTFLGRSFWSGWLENLQLTAAGYTLMPLVGQMHLYDGGSPARGRHLALFLTVLAVYLLVLGNLLVKLLYRRASSVEMVLGCLALYGLFSMTQFIGRTDPLNIYPLLVPFSVILVVIASRVTGMLFSSGLRPSARLASSRGPRQPGGFLPHAIASGLALSLVALALVNSEGYQKYPNVIWSLGDKVLANERCLLDVPDKRLLSARGPACGATTDEERESFNAEFPTIVAEVKKRSQAGEAVAILDQEGPIFYQAAGAAPWGRYVPLFPNLVTTERVDAVARELSDHPPENVLIRAGTLPDTPYVEVQRDLLRVIRKDYYLQSRIGSFNLWRHKDLTPAKS